MDLDMAQSSLPVADIGVYPTPLQRLDRLSAHLGGARIWVKRDDLTGLAMGGSKTRALGTLLGQALAEGADTIITCGPTTSNHVRLTAAAANSLGLKVILVLKGNGPEGGAQGNMLLNRIFGARLVFADVEQLHELEPVMEQVAADERARGARPYIVPGGGYSPIGALGYRRLVAELREQSARALFQIDAVMFASGSGCIQSGLLAGCVMERTPLQILGLTINRSVAELEARIGHDVEAALQLAGAKTTVSTEDVVVLDDFLGPGYAIPSDEGMEAIDLSARLEGLLLDPCYTGKAMAGVMHLSRYRFGREQNVVFIHTGGSPGIFNYSQQLLHYARRSS